MSLPSITAALCARCNHGVMEHGAVGDRPDIDPEYMPCEVAGCECVDFHRCDQPGCVECSR